MFKMRGVYPPMITPFNKNGDLDILSLEKLVKFLSQQVQGLFICGSYGSGPMMSLAERKLVAETTVKAAEGKVPIICHTGTTNTRDAIELSLHAKSIGCEAVAAVGPYYFKHKDEDLISYYTDIIQAVGKDFPVYIYNNPNFQGYEISNSALSVLKRNGLHGVKDATFDILNYATYMREFADDTFDVALGTEAMWLSARSLGCEAYIPGLGNAFPELCVKMWKEGMNDDYLECRKTQFLINEMRQLMYLAGSTQKAVYCMASIRGIIDAYPRLPFVSNSEEEKEKLQAALAKIGAFENVYSNN
jgi:dihydrodipicolinate synthase/N-acetylneuraminate lyase